MSISNFSSIAIIAATCVALLSICILLIVHIRNKKFEKLIEKQKFEIDHQKGMLKAAMESQENERKQIAKDLQDNIGMMLMTLRVNLNNPSEGQWQELKQLVDETHETISKISWNLMPTTIENFGLIQSTQELCKRLSVRDIPKIVFRELGDRISLDKDQELLLYRIGQEAISNAIKHSNAAKIEVAYHWTNGGLTLQIIDDGLGFEFPSSENKIKGRHGLGLYNIENRVALLGGELSFHKNNPTGTIVSVQLSLAS